MCRIKKNRGACFISPKCTEGCAELLLVKRLYRHSNLRQKLLATESSSNARHITTRIQVDLH